MGTNINCLSKNKSLKNLRRADKKKIAIKLLEVSTHTNQGYHSSQKTAYKGRDSGNTYPDNISINNNAS